MDEPKLKAKFKLTLIRHKSFQTTFFNTPLVSSETDDEDESGEWIRDYFEETVEMSTYLVAFVISNYKTISGTSRHGVLVEVAARAEAIEAGEGDFALAEAIAYLDFITDYLNFSYPYKKLSK